MAVQVYYVPLFTCSIITQRDFSTFSCYNFNGMSLSRKLFYNVWYARHFLENVIILYKLTFIK